MKRTNDLLRNHSTLEPLREDARRNRYNLKKSAFGSLYKNRTEDNFFLYSLNDVEWAIDHNRLKIDETFTSFDEGEHFLKRTFEAWLVRDDAFVSYLMEMVKIEKKNE